MAKRLPIILVLALVALGAWSFFGREDAGDPALLYGNVDIREVQLAFRVSGRVADLAVEEGDGVLPGQPLGRLDDVPLSDAVAVAEATLRQAEAQLAKFRAGSRPPEIRRAEAQRAEAMAELDNARRELVRQEEMMADSATSQRDLDAVGARVQAGTARVAAIDESLALLREGFRAEDIAAAEAQVAVAAARLRQAQTSLADTALEAPAAGTILTRAREPGAIVQAGQPVYTLSLDQPVRVRAYVDEPRLGRVVPGMAVRLHTDSSDRVYRGQVGFVSPRAEFTPRSVETEDLRTDLVYRIRITVTDPDDGLRQGMPVTIRLPEQTTP